MYYIILFILLGVTTLALLVSLFSTTVNEKFNTNINYRILFLETSSYVLDLKRTIKAEYSFERDKVSHHLAIPGLLNDKFIDSGKVDFTYTQRTFRWKWQAKKLLNRMLKYVHDAELSTGGSERFRTFERADFEIKKI